jgi:D-inositol-3-phosphate glycosyltransferase
MPVKATTIRQLASSGRSSEDIVRIAVLCFHASPLAQPGEGDGGGMSVYVKALCSALAHQGLDCTAYTRATSPEELGVQEVEPGFRVSYVRAGPLAPVGREALYGLVGEFTRSVADSLRMDVRLPQVIYANYWLSGIAGLSLRHILDIPLVCTFHTLSRVRKDDSRQRMESELEIASNADMLTVATPAEAGELRDLYGAEIGKVNIVTPGVDHAFFQPGEKMQARRAIGIAQGEWSDPLLLFAGRLQSLKGAHIAIEALNVLHTMKGCHRARLVLIGGPSGTDGMRYTGGLHELTDRLELGRYVRFVSPVAHEVLSSYYRAADVCLVPSESESFGLVALESMACGTPVVARAVGGLASLIDDGRNGFLIEGDSPLDFAAACHRLISRSDLAGTMGMVANWCSLRYTWAAAARDFIEALDNVVAGRDVQDQEERYSAGR